MYHEIEFITNCNLHVSVFIFYKTAFDCTAKKSAIVTADVTDARSFFSEHFSKQEFGILYHRCCTYVIMGNS